MQTLAARLRRLPLFALWPRAARRRRSDRLEWRAWLGAALLAAAAVPAAAVAGTLSYGVLAEHGRHQRAAAVLGTAQAAPMGRLEVLTYAMGSGAAVLVAAAGAVAVGRCVLRRRLAVHRSAEWAGEWAQVGPAWSLRYGGRTPGAP